MLPCHLSCSALQVLFSEASLLLSLLLMDQFDWSLAKQTGGVHQGDIVVSDNADIMTNVKEDYRCNAKCSPVHYCYAVVFVNHTAVVECRECEDICNINNGTAKSTNKLCEEYCHGMYPGNLSQLHGFSILFCRVAPECRLDYINNLETPSWRVGKRSLHLHTFIMNELTNFLGLYLPHFC